MLTPETFKTPPISEAIIEIRFTSPEKRSVDYYEAFHNAIQTQYPEKKKKVSWSQTINLTKGSAPVISAEESPTIEKFLFVSEDKTQIVQVGSSSLSFNKLKPYRSWETFSSEAKRIWSEFQAFAGPNNIQRIGLRYVNNIKLPLPVADFRDYCVLFPEFPSDMPHELSSFLSRFGVFDKQVGAEAAVTLVFDPKKITPTSLPLILDIDTYYKFDVFKPDTEAIWSRLDSLRNLKNRIFFSSITEQSKELFR